MLTWLLSLAVTACAVPAAAGKPLPFDLQDHAVVVPVTAGGAGPFRFLLDTGASRSVISRDLAAQSGFRTPGTTLMITPAGQSVHTTVGVTLQVGDRHPVRVQATVVNQGTLGRSGSVVDGILGQDVLSSLVYTIDYVERVISWDARCDEDRGEHRLGLRFLDGRALVTVDTEAAGPLHLIPDSGADQLVLFARTGRPLPPMTAGDVALLRTLSGERLMRRATVHRLDVGSLALSQVPAVVLPESDRAPRLGDGLLPLHLFSRVTFNGPAGYMSVVR